MGFPTVFWLGWCCTTFLSISAFFLFYFSASPPDLVPHSRYVLKRRRLLFLSPSTSFLFPVGCLLLWVGEREVCLKPSRVSRFCSSVSTGSIAPHAFISAHEASPWLDLLPSVIWLLSLCPRSVENSPPAVATVVRFVMKLKFRYT